MNGRNWYAVYTKPQSERKVAALLLKKKIENFCPHNRVMSGVGQKRKMVYEPLFPSFVFVHISETEMADVTRTNDVLSFVYWLGKPAIIKTAEIENIAHFNGAYYNIKVEKIPVNSAGMVHITKNAAIATNDIAAHSLTNVRLTLPSIGFAMMAETSHAPVKDYTENNTEPAL